MREGSWLALSHNFQIDNIHTFHRRFLESQYIIFPPPRQHQGNPHHPFDPYAYLTLPWVLCRSQADFYLIARLSKTVPATNPAPSNKTNSLAPDETNRAHLSARRRIPNRRDCRTRIGDSILPSLAERTEPVNSVPNVAHCATRPRPSSQRNPKSATRSHLTNTNSSSLYERRVVERVHRYQWPGIQLNLWILVMLVAACLIIGVFASFIETQQQLLLPIPWCVIHTAISASPSHSVMYFPYYITVACLVILFIGLLLWLVFQRRLLPAIVMIGAFILFILWFVGLVVVSIQLWGPDGSVSSTCNLAVFNRSPTGQSLDTLAWLEQRSICQAWQAVFSFALVGAIFLLWIMVMAYQVFASSVNDEASGCA
ncbi:uncharacterized protein CLUP02_13028 [Colletotrichum lupini]|uniref:MARVEL domain-containing protein n=1 Tax=Colletotrichum lupini TaxID=145971 RepID=A0A9Q8T1J7_9PEZI|nr:uncharacterized protein CLUP02_13028 [Colletotrichum lupini]UQC87523.1 hypothetical protein CLUP02_13028 [Colletotrichum lupini]